MSPSSPWTNHLPPKRAPHLHQCHSTFLASFSLLHLSKLHYECFLYLPTLLCSHYPISELHYHIKKKGKIKGSCVASLIWGYYNQLPQIWWLNIIKNSVEVTQNFKIELSCDPAIPLQGIYLKETKSALPVHYKVIHNNQDMETI